MAKYTAIKAEAQKRYDKLLNECGVFWAFSKEQFEEGKTPLGPGEKYVSIGAGGFMPKHNHAKLTAGMKEIDAWQKQAIKAAKADEVILYELNNYECFYTGSIEPAMDVLGSLGFTEEQVKKVYFANQAYTTIN